MMKTPMGREDDAVIIELGLGGGCHWCTEAVFASIAGVAAVEQGWLAGDPPDDDFSEGVVIRFDPGRVSLRRIVEIHLQTHSASSDHALRRRYRSAVYCNDERLRRQVGAVLAEWEARQGTHLVTRVLLLRAFRPSPPRLRNYYAENPRRPFCQRHIVPKLERIARRYPALVRRPVVC